MLRSGTASASSRRWAGRCARRSPWRGPDSAIRPGRFALGAPADVGVKDVGGRSAGRQLARNDPVSIPVRGIMKDMKLSGHSSENRRLTHRDEGANRLEQAGRDRVTTRWEPGEEPYRAA